MTDPNFGATPSDGVPPQSPDYPPPPPPQPGGFPPPPPGAYFPPPQNPSYPYPPPAGVYFDPMAPYGRDPLTGEPFSDKSKVIAGLLQLIGLFGLLGFGRIYIGQTNTGVTQLVVGVICAWVLSWLTCGISALVPVIWGVVDAISMFTGNVRDTAGRPLRDGT